MSLDSGGVSISIANPVDVVDKKLGNGYSKTNDPAEALRAAMEEYILSPEFKELTTTSCYNVADIRLYFLVHTTMPR